MPCNLLHNAPAMQRAVINLQDCGLRSIIMYEQLRGHGSDFSHGFDHQVSVGYISVDLQTPCLDEAIDRILQVTCFMTRVRSQIYVHGGNWIGYAGRQRTQTSSAQTWRA